MPTRNPKTKGTGHYVMDLFYPDSTARDGLRRDVLRIDAPSDQEAIAEAERVDSWRRTSSYRIRSIRTSSRSGDVVVYDSKVVPAAGDGTGPAPAIELGHDDDAPAHDAAPQPDVT